MNPSHLLAVLGTCSMDQLHTLKNYVCLWLYLMNSLGNSFCSRVLLLRVPIVGSSTQNSICGPKFYQRHTKWKIMARVHNKQEVNHCFHLNCLLSRRTVMWDTVLHYTVSNTAQQSKAAFRPGPSY